MFTLLTNNLSNIGLCIDIIAVLFLAKFHVPSMLLVEDGSSPLNITPDKPIKDANIIKYTKYKKITTSSYYFIAIGFLLQIQW